MGYIEKFGLLAMLCGVLTAVVSDVSYELALIEFFFGAFVFLLGKNK